MKTTTPKKKSQCQTLLAYLKRHKKGITTMEAFQHLGITCVHKRISELESYEFESERLRDAYPITRHREKTATGSIVTRYKLAR